MSDVKTGPPGPPKKHTPFVQVVYRKAGESLDLAGKAIVGIGGFGSLATAHHLADVNWRRLGLSLIDGGIFIASGIYGQAKAEET